MASQLLELAGPRFVLRCWGDFAIAAADGADQRPRGRKARALLAYLAMHPDKPLSRERLMALLWGDRGDEQARASLRQALFELRGFANGHGLLRVERDSVTLNGAMLDTDIRNLAALAQAGRYEELLEALPDPDETLFANLDGLSAGCDDWLLIERSRQYDRLQALIGDASASAVADGSTRAARALHGRLVDHVGQNGGAGSLAASLTPVAVSPMPGAVQQLQDRRSVLRMAVVAPVLAVGAAGGAYWWSTRGDGMAAGLHREAVGLTDSARTMLRERDGANVRAARGLLRRAVTLDPGYAPAWAVLGVASAIGLHDPQRLAEAESHARKAIAIDPDLAEGHAALGMILGFAGPEAGAHLRRAAALNPRDAQTQYWLSHHYGTELAFEQRLTALRASVASDPHWARGVNDAALMAWQMGHPGEARRYAQRLLKLDPQEAFACEYQLDLANGEFAAIVRKMLAARASFEQPGKGDRKLGSALLILGHEQPARVLLRLQPYQWEIASGAAPSPESLRRVDAGAVGDWFDTTYFLFLALQRALHAGRGEEIVAAYDSGGTGQLAALARDDVDRFLLVTFGPETGLALRAAGRDRDATILLARVERIIREAYQRGRVPIPFNVCAARLWAAQGKREQALALLGRAVAGGYHYAPVTPMPDIGDVFAFRELRGDPRFEALRNRLRNHLERERRALGPVLI